MNVLQLFYSVTASALPYNYMQQGLMSHIQYWLISILTDWSVSSQLQQLQADVNKSNI
jgi:hypothetical protein